MGQLSQVKSKDRLRFLAHKNFSGPRALRYIYQLPSMLVRLGVQAEL